MIFRISPKRVLPVLLGLASGLAGAACVPVAGVVKLMPDDACQVIGASPVKEGFTGQCFSVQLRLVGFPVATICAKASRVIPFRR